MGEGVAKRPFWLHQFAEYLLGLALVAVGVQSPTPLVPCVVAGVIIVHAAVTKAPLAAFQVIDRRLHRVIDVGIIAFEVVAALQPWVSIEGSTRMIMLAIAFVHTFIWWQSSFIEKVKRKALAPDPAAVTSETTAPATPGATPRPAAAPTGRSADIGRTAGRIVGSGVNTVRQMKAKRQQPPE
ncbi:MAG: hypothetical protein QM733_01780 [Ilumatobacteraceae bacterium]